MQHPLKAAAAADDACPGFGDFLLCWHVFWCEAAGAASFNSAEVIGRMMTNLRYVVSLRPHIRELGCSNFV